MPQENKFTREFMADQSHSLESYPPLFGVRRKLACPPLERIDFPAGDGRGLFMHHTSGGTRGPVIISPGTAMTALTYCIDSVPRNLVEFMVEKGFDVWLFDWRTSPLLAAHEQPYTMDDVARFDWPAVVAEVQRRTGKKQVSVVAHCLSSPCLMLSLVRGYLPWESLYAYVASQVGLDLVMTAVGRIKLKTHVDALLPGGNMIHQKPPELTGQLSDNAISLLSWIIPKSYTCDNHVCPRHSATFGDVIYHPRVNAATHAMMGDLIPECLTGFLKDVAIWARAETVLTPQDRPHLSRLRLPITFISGSQNRMFLPESTERTYTLLCEANGSQTYRRKLYDNFGHLDCFIGDGACETIWPDIAEAVGEPGRGNGKPAASSAPPEVLGLTFSEKMSGGFSLGETAPEAGAARGQGEGNALTLHGNIVLQDLNRFLTDPEHAGGLSGTVDFPPLGTNLLATGGIFNLFSPTSDPAVKYMVYEVGFQADGKDYYFAGKKIIRQAPVTNVWKATTTLYSTLYAGKDKTGSVVGAGILSLGLADLTAMISTMRATNARSLEEAIEAEARFGRFFLGELWDTYVKHARH
jgi:predicted alpha/beta hydrolase